MTPRYKTIQLKQGATLSLFGTAVLPTGTWTARASVRTADDSLVGEISVTLTPPVAPSSAHSIALEASAAATNTWPVPAVMSDIRFEDAFGTVLYGETFAIAIARGETRG